MILNPASNSRIQILRLTRVTLFMITFSKYHFQILFSIIVFQLLQKIYRQMYPTNPNPLLGLTIPSPGKGRHRVEFFLTQFLFSNNLFKILRLFVAVI